MYLDKTIQSSAHTFCDLCSADGELSSPFLPLRPGAYLKDRIQRAINEGVSPEAEVGLMYDEDSDDFEVDFRCNITTDPFDIAAAQLAEHPRRVAEAITAAAAASSPPDTSHPDAGGVPVNSTESAPASSDS